MGLLTAALASLNAARAKFLRGCTGALRMAFRDLKVQNHSFFKHLGHATHNDTTLDLDIAKLVVVCSPPDVLFFNESHSWSSLR